MTSLKTQLDGLNSLSTVATYFHSFHNTSIKLISRRIVVLHDMANTYWAE